MIENSNHSTGFTALCCDYEKYLNSFQQTFTDRRKFDNDTMNKIVYYVSANAADFLGGKDWSKT
jgi:hypothetical protein